MAKVTRIYLPNRYRDTDGLRIEPGEYDINDDALRGKGQYLVDTRHAFVIESAEPEQSAPVAVEEEPVPEQEANEDEADTSKSPSRSSRSKK